MSSRLFQEVREKAGLAYSVYSYVSPYEDCGNLIVYAGVNPEKSDRALEAISKCIRELKEGGISDDEFLRGREQMKSGTFVLAGKHVFADASLRKRDVVFGQRV